MTRLEVANYKHSVLRLPPRRGDGGASEGARRWAGPGGVTTTAQYHFPDGFNLELSPKVAGRSGGRGVTGWQRHPRPASLMDTLKNTRPPPTRDSAAERRQGGHRRPPPPSPQQHRPRRRKHPLSRLHRPTHHELAAEAPQNYKFKVVANNTPDGSGEYVRELRLSAASIPQASLAPFSSLWSSKTEYEEFGKSCIDLRPIA
ncbi:hypothetical protein TYRP_017004 [Tyrophagus putrescentiae]|nr:hypothetical protein TYRP_017004 [Tyrophagus putrescentiae]